MNYDVLGLALSVGTMIVFAVFMAHLTSSNGTTQIMIHYCQCDEPKPEVCHKQAQTEDVDDAAEDDDDSDDDVQATIILTADEGDHQQPQQT
jgi:hypothetical protein